MRGGRLAVVCVLCLTGFSLAATETTAPAKEAVEIRLKDGGIVKMAIEQESVEIETKYGKLTVPIKDIRRIDFGLHVTAETKAKIEQSIRDLGHDQPNRRKEASEALIALGAQAYKPLLKALESSDAEVVRLGKITVEKMREKYTEAELTAKEEDVIRTKEHPLYGRVVSKLKASSPAFGTKEFEVSLLKRVNWQSGIVNKDVAVEGEKYARKSKWMDTGIELSEDMELTLTADGKINLNDDGTGQWTTTPVGNRNWGLQPDIDWKQFGGIGALPQAEQGKFARVQAAQVKQLQQVLQPQQAAFFLECGRPVQPNNLGLFPGALIGRIGENGTPFLIGAKFQAKVKQEGKLYVHVVPAQGWGETKTSGEYKLRVQAE